MSTQHMDLATLGGGCFWCIEAVLKDLKGVESVVSGYANGQTQNPTYKEVCGGRTGHAEVVQVRYDPSLLDYRDLLNVFFAMHDPTTRDRQGNDVGTQYRSTILTHDDTQAQAAREVIQQLEARAIFPAPIVTVVEALDHFYPAEAYHQNYFELNPNQPYCQAVVAPKVAKFRKQFLDRTSKH